MAKFINAGTKNRTGHHWCKEEKSEGRYATLTCFPICYFCYMYEQCETKSCSSDNQKKKKTLPYFIQAIYLVSYMRVSSPCWEICSFGYIFRYRHICLFSLKTTLFFILCRSWVNICSISNSPCWNARSTILVCYFLRYVTYAGFGQPGKM